MYTTKLSSKGQVIIPNPIRLAHRWQSGLEFVVVETKEGILLKPKSTFAKTSLDQVAGCLPYKGKAKSLEDMEAFRKSKNFLLTENYL